MAYSYQERYLGGVMAINDSFWQIFSRRKSAYIGLFIIVSYVIIALFAPWIAPHDYRAQDRTSIMEGPSSEYPLGTDRVGRCLLSRIIFGARISLTVGLVAVGIGSSIGLVIGSISGYMGGWVDRIVMGLVDIVWSFPTMLLAIALTAILQPGLHSVIIALGLVSWPEYARIIRSQFLAVKQKEFVEAARSVGASDFRIIRKHLLPNSIAPVIVVATLGMATAVLVEATFSYLGLGAQPPQPSWGSILSMGKDFIYHQPLMSIAPGVAIMIMVLGFNLLGDAIRDVMDPRLKK